MSRNSPVCSRQSEFVSWPLVVVPKVCGVLARQGLLELAVKTTGGREATVAVTVFEPSAVPSVQLVTVAMPEASVTRVPPVIEPPPLVTANVTVTPANGDPLSSRTMTDGLSCTVVPVEPVSVVAEFALTVAGRGGPDESPPPHET
jgi:hypothetical protein